MCLQDEGYAEGDAHDREAHAALTVIAHLIVAERNS